VANDGDTAGNSGDGGIGADTAVGGSDDQTLDVAEGKSGLEQAAVKLLLTVDDVDAREGGNVVDVEGLFDCWSVLAHIFEGAGSSQVGVAGLL
jgi:hypothetical protein